MQYLNEYMNDHLAGSVAALELLDRLIEVSEGKPLERFSRDLRKEIETDQETLKELMAKLGAKESAVRKAGAWIMEKLSRAKIPLSKKEDGEGEMGLFLALEALALGITGKRMLWRALAAAAETVTQLRGPDYAALEERAVEQHNRVETQRLEVARKVFRSE
jgi:hypothetical protein